MQTNDELIRAARRNYQREWRAKNPDKVRANQQRYWLKKAKESDSSIVNTDNNEPCSESGEN